MGEREISVPSPPGTASFREEFIPSPLVAHICLTLANVGSGRTSDLFALQPAGRNLFEPWASARGQRLAEVSEPASAGDTVPLPDAQQDWLRYGLFYKGECQEKHFSHDRKWRRFPGLPAPVRFARRSAVVRTSPLRLSAWLSVMRRRQSICETKQAFRLSGGNHGSI